MLKAFLKDSAIYAIPSFVSRGLSLFLIPLYTRVLDPSDYGALDLITVFAGIVNLTVAFEISQGVARFYSAEPDPSRKTGYASSAFWFTVVCYLTFLILSFLFSNEISPLVMGQVGFEGDFKIGLFYIFFSGLVFFIQNQLRWEMKSKSYALVSLIFTLVTAAFCIWLAYFKNEGLIGLLWGMVWGAVVAALVGIWLLRKSIPLKINRELLAEMLKFSIPLVPASLAVWVSGYIDRLMISHFLSLSEVGLYGIGFRLASLITLVMVGFQAALTPLVYTYHQNPETPAQLAKIFRFCLAVSLILFAGINLFVNEILSLFTQPSFYGASKVVIYLVPSILLAQMYIFAPGIFIAKKTHYVLWINVFGALVNTLLNYLMIPVLGFVGAGLATLIGNGLVFALYMIFSQKYYPIPHKWAPMLLTVLAVTGSVVVVKVLESVGWLHFVLIGLGMVLSIGFIFIFRIIRREELQLVIQKIHERFN